jgi:hypothetical protein
MSLETEHYLQGMHPVVLPYTSLLFSVSNLTHNEDKRRNARGG